MLARLALASDETALAGLAVMQVRETVPHLGYDDKIAKATFRRYLDTGNPTIFVVEDRREVVGYLVALTHDYAVSAGQFVTQEVIYVRPDKRGTRAAARLLTLYNQWADQVGAREVFTGIANGFKPERTARFMEHFGFVQVGAHLRRIRG